MKYYPKLLEQYRLCAEDKSSDVLTGYQFNYLVKQLTHPNCKRLIFDARQAKVFDESEEIDERRRDKIKPPFGFFYLELTEPIQLKAQEPGCCDVLWSLLFQSNVIEAVEVINKGKARRTIPITKVTFFYKSNDLIQFVDRTWSMSPEGYPLVGRPPKHITSRYNTPAKGLGMVKGEGATASGLVDPKLLPDYVQEGELVSIFELEKYGWWEDAMISNSNLLWWIFAYTMAKSVEIVQVPVSRQVVRAAMRKEGKLPEPWHVVQVRPHTIKGRPEVVGETDGVKHSYRYDVIGHLRFNRHKTKDGYKDTIEWIADHQRGLENELYIPKTYKVEKDKHIAVKEMQEYFES
jgi:hypothetical protein